MSKNPVQNLRDRGYTEDQIRLFKQNNRHSQKLHSAGLEIGGDLSDFEFKGFNFLYTLFRQYDNHGTLPYSGSLGDQPAAIIEALQIMDTLKFEAEEQVRKDNERESKKRG